MPEMHLRQLGASEPFTKIKKWIQKLKKNKVFTIYLSK